MRVTVPPFGPVAEPECVQVPPEQVVEPDLLTVPPRGPVVVPLRVQVPPLQEPLEFDDQLLPRGPVPLLDLDQA
ncbi:MAG: hypothetical protein NW223_16375 [Hyphomicrobiaceae bacterium]|nr:hypothetical protein [Hyphomicrobiaceae bacterium]